MKTLFSDGRSFFWIVLFCFLLATNGIAGEGPNDPVCVIKTSMGDIYVALFAEEAPKTVKNFLQLAEGDEKDSGSGDPSKIKNHFYDNLIFHRVIKNFMIQGGCPNGNGTGGPGYTFEDEINAVELGLDKLKVVQPDGNIHPYLLVRTQQDYSRIVVMPLARQMGIHSQQQFQDRIQEVEQQISNLTVKACYENMGYQYNETLKSHAPARGVIAMANSGPNTNGSQFFINLKDTPWLAGKHTVFGKVVSGMDVVDKIGEVAVDQNYKPHKAVTIISIRRYTQQLSDQQMPK